MLFQNSLCFQLDINDTRLALPSRFESRPGLAKVCNAFWLLYLHNLCLTIHIKLNFVILEVSHIDPLVLSRLYLLVVDDVVSCWAVTIHIEPEIVAT